MGSSRLELEAGPDAGPAPDVLGVPIDEATGIDWIKWVKFNPLPVADVSAAHVIRHLNALSDVCEIVDRALSEEVDGDRKEHLAAPICDQRRALTCPDLGADVVRDTLL